MGYLVVGKCYASYWMVKRIHTEHIFSLNTVVIGISPNKPGSFLYMPLRIMQITETQSIKCTTMHFTSEIILNAILKDRQSYPIFGSPVYVL